MKIKKTKNPLIEKRGLDFFCTETGKEYYRISFSGGRTSAYMTKLLLDNFSDKYKFIVTFANTGLEHPKTLEFVKNCDEKFGFNTVWLESVVHPQKGIACSHKIVNFETASRNGEPYADAIAKYGIPNISFSHCTRTLKLMPIRSYNKSLGLSPRRTKCAIGIRADEIRRVNREVSQHENIQYPLIDIWPTDKQDVIDWWEDQEFNLEIEEFEGNCRGCFKKTLTKHFMQIKKDPSVYEFFDEMEELYSKKDEVEKFFFRGNMSTKKLFQIYEEVSANPTTNKQRKIFSDIYENSGCSESCEIYNTDND